MFKEFEGIWIPAEIMDDKELNMLEKIYLSTLKMNINLKTSNEMAEFLGISHSRLSEIKNKLKKKGYLFKENLDSAQKKKKVLINKGRGYKCEWCECLTTAIQEHHYPISKKDGGTETVKICPNCHYEFHCLEGVQVDSYE